MSTTLTIPTEIVGHLRNGLHSTLGDAADDIAKVVSRSRREHHPEWYRDPLARLDQIRELLDHIGWAATNPPTEIDVDLDRHRQAILGALRVAILVAEADLDEAAAVALEHTNAHRALAQDAATRVPALREFVATVEDHAGRLEERRP